MEEREGDIYIKRAEGGGCDIGRGDVSDSQVNDSEPTAVDKALSGLLYLFPLMDALPYAAHVFTPHIKQVAILQL